MQRLNGSDKEVFLPVVAMENRPIRQLVKAKDVATKLGVSISWVVQHASGKRKPYLPAVKMGHGRSPLLPLQGADLGPNHCWAEMLRQDSAQNAVSWKAAPAYRVGPSSRRTSESLSGASR